MVACPGATPMNAADAAPGPAMPRPVSPRARVLELITLSDWGGAQEHVFALARGFRGTFDVTVACAPGGPLVERLRREGIPVVEIPSLRREPSPLDDLRTLVRLARWIRQERFALVHCHSTKAGLLGRIASRIAGVPGIIFTAHGWAFAGGWHPAVRVAAALAEMAAARISTAIICVAHHLRQEALRMRIGPPDRIVVVHNGVDPGPWLQDSPAGARSARAGDPCTAVMVCRLNDPKDPATLLDAWQRVGGPHRLLIVGDGPLRPGVELMAGRNGLADRVVMLGARGDVPALLRGADVFVLSSRWEGLPIVVIEAMLSGLPVVATDVGGVREVVVEGETGFLVPPQDPSALASALERLLGDAELRRQMGAAGRKRALAHFTEARMLADTAEVYARALAPRGRAGVETSRVPPEAS